MERTSPSRTPAAVPARRFHVAPSRLVARSSGAARPLATLLLLAAPACSAQGAPEEADAPLERVAAIELPDVAGRIDHLAVDLARGRLYVAALGNDSVEVIDLATDAHVRSLAGPREPQGILYLPEQDRVVVASGGEGTLVVRDGGTLATVATVTVGADADNLRYDARRAHVLVAYGDALGVVDARTWEVLARVPLGGGHPEGFQLAPDGARAFVDVPGARAVAVVDLERGAVVARWHLEEARSNYPLAIVPGAPDTDEPDLCVVGCRAPARLLVRALPGGEARAALALSGDVDDLFHDARRRRLYAACGEGWLDVLERGADGLGARRRVPTAPGARTCLWVPERDRLYVAAPRRGSAPARVLVLAPRD